MSLGCNCEAGLSNTGRPNCVPIQSVTSSLIMVPLYDNDGALNGIDLSSALPTWSSLINEADSSKRWYPLPAFENVELPKADSQFEEANSGRKVFLRQGKRSFLGQLWEEDSSPQLLAKLQNNRCVDFGVYIVDINGNLVGSKVGNFLYPIPVDNPSFDPKYMFATDSTASKIEVGFDFERLFDEGTMYMITPEEAGVNFTSLKGLLDVNFSNASSSTTVFTSKVSLDYGTALNPIVVKGLLVADFSVYNVTDASAVSLASVTESPAGTYALTYSSAQTSADVIRVSIAKDGYTGSVEVTI